MLKLLSVAALAAVAYAQGPATPELTAENGDLVIRLPRDGEGRFVRQQTVNLNALQDRIQELEDVAVPMVAATARTNAAEAASAATLTLLTRLTDRLDTMQSSVIGIAATVDAQLAAGMSTVNSQMTTQRDTATAAMSVQAAAQTAAMAETTTTINSQLSSTIAGIDSTLAAAAATAAASNTAMNSSVNAAIVAANNAATPSVYVQWGHKACTAPTGVAVTRIYPGWTFGSRHNYNGGGSTLLCLKDASGTGGGVNQGGQDSNDFVVPMRREHSNYNNMPSNQNIWRAKEGWIIPCAKCEYAKSCFMESGVADCPRNYHKMYTGYLHAGHQGHHGNNDRICIDKNPDGSDYNESGGWNGHLYPTLSRDSNVGSRRGRVALACHRCCRQ